MQNLKDLVQTLYPDEFEKIGDEILAIVAANKTSSDNGTDSKWYKQINQYAVYPNSFSQEGKTPIQALTEQLPRISKLGFNTVHVLPFLDSPQVDKGFDIRDFYKVNPDFGSFEDILQLKNTAHENGIRIFMDLVFNHISDEHEWFLKAENGDPVYRDYFIWSKDKPEFIRTFDRDGAVWAEYAVNGNQEQVSVVFPEMVGQIPHWRMGKDGNWYYHTFYPQQLDTNWLNPKVFLEYVKILAFWVSKGFNFRLDAILFVGKGPYKHTDFYDTKTHTIITLLHEIARMINPETVLIVETFEDLPKIIQYFGTNDSHQTELAYNFHLCTHLWATLVAEDSTYLWDKLLQMWVIPDHADWLNFLRNHDELSYAFMSDYLRTMVNNNLKVGGEPIRGEFGLSGRVFSFLHENVKKHILAHFLLISIPGGVALQYGDEYGMTNVPLAELPPEDQTDTRNINRGKLTSDKMFTPQAGEIYPEIEKMFNARKLFKEFADIRPDKMYELDKNKYVFSAIYQKKDARIIVLINISGTKQAIQHDHLQNMNVHTSVGSVWHDTKAGTVTLEAYSGVWLVS